ncbi:MULTISPECIES: hypothetical protein [Actinomadura]|uniref:Zinc-binding dehydrogenase n=1 Tax=Actinomadura yumaensis TaxID=111807 RepID=A0ABW2CMZ7_9ACTN|nr:hypothetical protein [Actinomadura sp. J1-007]MWK38540.1 hypothetical protein [Actinomadura sp. J1-007]
MGNWSTVNGFTRPELNVVGIRSARHRDALAVLSLLRGGRISSRITARFPLADTRKANELMQTSQDLVGRVVLKP